MLHRAIALVVSVEALAITSLFPYVGYMIVSFGVAENPEDVGYYAGILASTFAAAQVCAYVCTCVAAEAVVTNGCSL